MGKSRKYFRAAMVDGEVVVSFAWFASQGEARGHGWWGTAEAALERLRDNTIEEINRAERQALIGKNRLSLIREAICRAAEEPSP